MKKLFVLFLVSFIFIACATSQKQAKNTDFVLTQEELEEYFPQVDTSEFGHCTRCGILNKD